MADQQPPGWGPSPGPSTSPELRAPTPAWYRRGWVLGLAGLVLGLILGAVAAGPSGQQATRTTGTSTVKVFTDNCAELAYDAGRIHCEQVIAQAKAFRDAESSAAAAQSTATTAAPTTAAPTTAAPTTAPKPKPTSPPARTYGDGTYEVGVEIQPGTYKTKGGGTLGECYWARHKTLEDILDNNLSAGPMTMIVKRTDRFIEFNGGCEWRKV